MRSLVLIGGCKFVLPLRTHLVCLFCDFLLDLGEGEVRVFHNQFVHEFVGGLLAFLHVELSEFLQVADEAGGRRDAHLVLIAQLLFRQFASLQVGLEFVHLELRKESIGFFAAVAEAVSAAGPG